jgi:hypothetical protein
MERNLLRLRELELLKIDAIRCEFNLGIVRSCTCKPRGL